MVRLPFNVLSRPFEKTRKGNIEQLQVIIFLIFNVMILSAKLKVLVTSYLTINNWLASMKKHEWNELLFYNEFWNIVISHKLDIDLLCIISRNCIRGGHQAPVTKLITPLMNFHRINNNKWAIRSQATSSTWNKTKTASIFERTIKLVNFRVPDFTFQSPTEMLESSEIKNFKYQILDSNLSL